MAPVLTAKIISFLTISAMVLLVSACTVERAVVGPTGRLTVLMPRAELWADGKPADWAVDWPGKGGARLAVGEKDNNPAIRIMGGAQTSTMVRRVLAPLLVTPYLGWSWALEWPENNDHPVRLIVGFKVRKTTTPDNKNAPLPLLGAIPPHDRKIILTSGSISDDQGTNNRITDAPVLIDSSHDNTTWRIGSPWTTDVLWQSSAVDLSDLYQRSWPKDDLTKVDIVYVGFTVMGDPVPGDPVPSKAYLSRIVLSR